MSGNFQGIDKIQPKSLAYIRKWERLQKAREAKITSFDCLPIKARFTLPGGECEQVKLTPTLALAGGYVVVYFSWERVAPV